MKSVLISGTQVLSTMWASESNMLVGLHDASYSVWYCPGEACMDATVISLTKVTVDLTYVVLFQCIIQIFHIINIIRE